MKIVKKNKFKAILLLVLVSALGVFTTFATNAAVTAPSSFTANSEKILDEFNEFLFDITSKIPVDLIKNAKKDKSEEKKTASPYTKEAKKKIKIPKIFIIILIIVFLIIVCYAILSSYKGNDFSDKDITYSIRR